jgi:phosphoribosyl-ATP pyrophosphohydrolase/phosphoribosyl-AMP cyclohydrolase
MNIDMDKIDWAKGDGLVPAIVQDALNLRVLMLGYMNRDALLQTIESKRVTFFSRSKNALWVKGETSGNFLDLVSADVDCDGDTLLIKATPHGPACHKGTATCFSNGDGDSDSDLPSVFFLEKLGNIIRQRHQDLPEGSYTTQLFKEGTSRIAQKVGEEGVELSLAHVAGDKNDILNESADLLFHMLVLLEDAGLSLRDVCKVLQNRH